MLDYKLKESEELQKNIKILRSMLEKGFIDKSLRIKIDNYCELYGFEYELIKYKILEDDLFCIQFCKSPQKQSLHQKLALEEIKSIPKIQNAILLPSGGSGSMYVVSGLVLPYSQAKNTSTTNKTKSIDFVWDYIDNNGVIIKCYATHKYTKVSGGSQDNQFKDILNYMDNAKHHMGNDYFFAICDGEYYQQSYNGYKNKIDYIIGTHKGNRCFALTVNDLAAKLLTI